MHEFLLEQGNDSFRIDFENYKFLVGTNFVKKYQIAFLFRNFFNKVTNSSFALEGSLKRTCNFDDKPIEIKLWRYIEVSPNFDLETDLKMGTKSLFSKYLDSFSDVFEYNEYFNTLKTLINSLNEEFFENETSFEIGEKKVNLFLDEITRNIIFKQIIPLISCNDFDCNSGDLDYEELILLQFALIDKIASKNKDNYIFINAEIPFLTKKIISRIFGLKYQNCFVLINTNSVPQCKYQDVYLCSKYLIDFSNDENIIENIMEMPFHIEKEELLSSVQHFLDNINAQESKNKVTEELFK